MKQPSRAKQQDTDVKTEDYECTIFLSAPVQTPYMTITNNSYGHSNSPLPPNSPLPARNICWKLPSALLHLTPLCDSKIQLLQQVRIK